MAWNVLQPPAARKAQHGTAFVRAWPNGSLRIIMSLTKDLHARVGLAERCAIEAGDGDDLGKLRLTFGPGAFAVQKSGNKGAIKIMMEPFGEVGQRATSKGPVQVLSLEGAVIVLQLPLAQWGRAGAAPAKPSAPATAPPAPAPKAAWPLPADAFDPLAYLQGKGHGAERWTNGRFKIDGEIVTLQQLLHKVNVHRAKADLPPATVEHLKV